MLYHISLKSSNAKTGEMVLTTSSKETCPVVCPLRKLGCYASTASLNIHWLAVTRQQRGVEFNEFVNQLSDLPANTVGRFNQAGDLPGKGNRINGKKLKQLVKATKNKRFFSYTHKLVDGKSYVAKQNKKHIKFANKNGLTINLSANNVNHADKLKKLNIGPVVTILPLGAEKVSYTPAGHKVILCPEQYKEGVTCLSCQLCQKQRNVIVGFEAHGVSKKIVSLMANNA